ALIIAEFITRQPAIGVRRRRQRVEYSHFVEIRRRVAETGAALPIAIVQSRTDLDGFGEIGDRALEISFLIERTPSVEMILRGARRLRQTSRRDKTQSDRGLRDKMKFHTQLSLEWWGKLAVCLDSFNAVSRENQAKRPVCPNLAPRFLFFQGDV